MFSDEKSGKPTKKNDLKNRTRIDILRQKQQMKTDRERKKCRSRSRETATKKRGEGCAENSGRG